MSDHYFTPLDENETLPPPQTYSANEDKKTENTGFFRNDIVARGTQKVRLLWSFIVVFVGLMAFKEAYTLYFFMAQLGYWASIPTLFFYGIFLFVLGRQLLKIRANRKNVARIAQLQQQANVLYEDNQYGKAEDYIGALKRLYEKKPQAELLKNCLDNIPDYGSDREIIELIDSNFFEKLDQQAIVIITRYSKQTTFLVTISPLAIMDMLFSLWRGFKMIGEISHIYGFSSSINGHYQLTKAVLHQLIFIGGTDLITDQLLSLSAGEAMMQISARATQGVGAGVFNARIGFQAMIICRPLYFKVSNKPSLMAIIKQLKSSIFKRS